MTKNKIFIMKSIIIYNTRSGNTEELANKMKDILQKNGHEADIYRDKDIKSQIQNNEKFFDSYDLLVFGSCTHAMAPARSFKSLLKVIKKQNIQNKKLICFGTSGGSDLWKKACKGIQKRFPQLDHIGDIGCVERDNDGAMKEFEELVKKI